MPKIINILHVITKLDIGGAENLLLSIAKNMDYDRYRIAVCCISHAGTLAEEFEKIGVEVISFGLMKKKGWDKKIISAIENVIKQGSFDIVHTHLYHANLYGSFAAKRCSIPSIMSIQNTYSHHKLHRRILNWYISRYVQTIVVGSEDIKRDVMKYDWISSSKITVIDNCVDLDKIKAEIPRDEMRRQLKIPDNTVVLGTIGRLVKQKGHCFLIQALDQLRDSETDYCLLLVGDGKKRQELEVQVTNLKLEGKVFFLGSRTDIGNILGAIDIFIMSSLWEGLSLAMLTAMAAEKPLIATDVGGVKNVLGENKLGLVIEAGKPDAIVSAVLDIIEHKDAAHERAKKALALVHEKYSDNAMVRSLAQVYESCIQIKR